MYNPLPNWQQQGSYVEPVAIPASHADAAPLVCVSFNADWVPYLLGALSQLAQPTTWIDTGGTALQDVLSDVQVLSAEIALASPCVPAAEPALGFNAASAGNVTFSTDIVPGTNWTIGGWFTLTNPAATGLLYIFGLPAGVVPPFNQLFVDGSTHKLNNGWVHSGGSQTTLTGATSVTSGNHHVVITKTGSAVVLYLDGASDASATIVAGPFNSAGGVSTFGHDAAGSTLQAIMWRWYMYASTALSSTDVATWYAAGTTGTPPGSPTNAWLFDEGTGTTIHDSVGSNNGTAGAATFWVTHT